MSEETAELNLSWLTRIAMMLGLGKDSHAMTMAERREKLEKSVEDLMRRRLPEDVRTGDVLPLVLYPDPLLHQKSQPVVDFNDDFRQLVTSMGATMYLCGGVGLSAVQIGVPLRVFVTDMRKLDEQGASVFRIFVNPEILSVGESVPMVEGCLSLPNIHETIVRPGVVTIRAQNQIGQTFEATLEGWPARVFMHEMEHLDGGVLLDRMGKLARRLAEKKIAGMRRSVKIDETNGKRKAARRSEREKLIRNAGLTLKG